MARSSSSKSWPLLGLAFLASLAHGFPHHDDLKQSLRARNDAGQSGGPRCATDAVRLHLKDPPYDNFFYSDCDTAAQVVLTNSPGKADLATTEPRLLVAWPAGNSGVVAFFSRQDGVKEGLEIKMRDPDGTPLRAIYEEEEGSDVPRFGVSGVITFNKAATLTVAILGSVRTMRDYIEGPRLLVPEIQDKMEYESTDDDEVVLSRTWFDGKTVTKFSFIPEDGMGDLLLSGKTVDFAAGTYRFSASFNYPQLKQLAPQQVLRPEARALIEKKTDQAHSLSFLSYTNKLLAGAWRFLTYFGRDTMISFLLLRPVLSEGEGGAIEAAIGSVLERINNADGSAAHEETIGDYAMYLNQKQQGVLSTEPGYDYKMVDTDFFVPVMLASYFVESAIGRDRAEPFLCQTATENPRNRGLTYRQLAIANIEKILEVSAAFAKDGGQVRRNLIRLKEEEDIGEWRDSEWGLGGGRIPYNVNGALVPAGLRAVSALAKMGLFPDHPEWVESAEKYAQVWEDEAIKFFKVELSEEEAKSRLENYARTSGLNVPSNADSVTDDVTFYAVSLEGGNEGDKEDVVEVMNTDDCFRLFLLNPTNDQFTEFIEQVADNILRPFPAGLTTDVGLVVANPAFGSTPFYKDTFSTNAYHGTVVWGWPLAMMAAALEKQLKRCEGSDLNGQGPKEIPNFCKNDEVYRKVVDAYNRLWDVLDANSELLSSEVWSWKYEGGSYEVAPLGSFPPPEGVNPTESNVRQLWSLAFLAVTRNGRFR